VFQVRRGLTDHCRLSQTLSSLALVFALHHFKPTPLYFMDEIDAALDFKNVSIVAHYIKERTKNAQFIIISLRNNMFELADRLVGIYKTHVRVSTLSPVQYPNGLIRRAFCPRRTRRRASRSTRPPSTWWTCGDSPCACHANSSAVVLEAVYRCDWREMSLYASMFFQRKKKKVGRILDQPVKWRILDQWWCLVYIYL